MATIRSAALVLLLSIAPATLAQSGGLQVRVFDAADRSPLPGATVTLSSDHGLVTASAMFTNAGGIALFPVLPVGSGYSVEVALPGFGTQRLGDLTVKSGVVHPVDVLLALPQEERVQVTARAPVVDVDEVGAGTKFTDVFIEDLPQSGRRYQDVLPRSPGVLDTDGDGNPNVHGARTRDFRAQVSGISNVDPLTGFWLSSINLDSVEELEVIAHGAGVEFGRAQGGFARIIQKQGTNRFEGVFGMLYRSSALDGEGAGNVNTVTAADFTTLQPSLRLSGPIVKDRLWYRLSHEYIDREDPVDLLGQLAVTTTKQRISADQLTWQVSPRNRLAFQIQNDPLEVDNIGLDSATPVESTRRFERSGPTYSIAWTAPLSPTVLIDSLVAYQDHSNDFLPADPEATQGCLTILFNDALDDVRCLNLTSNLYSGPHPESLRDQRQRLTAQTQATLFRQAAGHSHRLKFGFSLENERYLRQLDRGPEMTLRILNNLDLCRIVNPTPPFTGCFPADPPIAEVTLSVPAPRSSTARATGNNWAIYGEDQWKPLPNLSVTFGLRFDHAEIVAAGYEPFDPAAEAADYFTGLASGDMPSQLLRQVFTAHEDVVGYLNGLAAATGLSPSEINLGAIMAQTAFWSPKRRRDDVEIVNDNLAPRLSLAWDPWRNGKTKFALSAGRYYDKLFLAIPLVEVEPPVTTTSFLAQTRQSGGFFFPTIAIVEGFSLEVSPLTARVVDRDLGTPYQDELTLSVERELFTETALRLSYVRRRFRDQLQDVDVNHGPGDFGRCRVTVIQQGNPNVFDPFLDYSVIASNGSGQQLTDVATGETYLDTDPGAGDGRLDDCGGDLFVARFPGQGDTAIDTPDGQPDAYVLNPGWSEILLLGNFNAADYRAFVLELTRRLYRNWELEAFYTFAEAEGQAEDFDLLLGNEASLREDEAGFLDYDQRHNVQVNATTRAWGFRFGGSVRWDSGLPYSILLSAPIGFFTPPAYPFQQTQALRPRLRYPTGQRNDQRSPSYWTVDARVSKEIPLNRRTLLQLSIEAFNLLNDDAIEVESQINSGISGTRRFGRRWQLGLRLSF